VNFKTPHHPSHLLRQLLAGEAKRINIRGLKKIDLPKKTTLYVLAIEENRPA
jgi:hypothetical protein